MTLPSRAELAAMLTHVVAREFPETLEVFRRAGVPLPARGGVPVSAAVDGDAGPLLDALADAIRWREPAL